MQVYSALPHSLSSSSSVLTYSALQGQGALTNSALHGALSPAQQYPHGGRFFSVEDLQLILGVVLQVVLVLLGALSGCPVSVQVVPGTGVWLGDVS